MPLFFSVWYSIPCAGRYRTIGREEGRKEEEAGKAKNLPNKLGRINLVACAELVTKLFYSVGPLGLSYCTSFETHRVALNRIALYRAVLRRIESYCVVLRRPASYRIQSC